MDAKIRQKYTNQTMKRSLRYVFATLSIALVISGCSISDRIKNNASESTFVLKVFANDTCELTINGAKLLNLERKVGIWGGAVSGHNYFDICSVEGGNEISIYISSMYPNLKNPPLAYANLKTTVENDYGKEHMYFPETMVFPITVQNRLFLTRTNPYFGIDDFAVVQLSILDPDWESFNYSKSYAWGWSITGYRLSAVLGKATFYGVQEIDSHKILYMLVGSVRRAAG